MTVPREVKWAYRAEQSEKLFSLLILKKKILTIDEMTREGQAVGLSTESCFFIFEQ